MYFWLIINNCYYRYGNVSSQISTITLKQWPGTKLCAVDAATQLEINIQFYSNDYNFMEQCLAYSSSSQSLVHQFLLYLIEGEHQISNMEIFVAEKSIYQTEMS